MISKIITDATNGNEYAVELTGNINHRFEISAFDDTKIEFVDSETDRSWVTAAVTIDGKRYEVTANDTGYETNTDFSYELETALFNAAQSELIDLLKKSLKPCAESFCDCHNIPEDRREHIIEALVNETYIDISRVQTSTIYIEVFSSILRFLSV